MKINVLGRAEVASGPGAQTKGRNGAARVSAPSSLQNSWKDKAGCRPIQGLGEGATGKLRGQKTIPSPVQVAFSVTILSLADCRQDCGPCILRPRAMVLVHRASWSLHYQLWIKIVPYSGVQGAKQPSFLVKRLLSYLDISSVKYIFQSSIVTPVMSFTCFLVSEGAFVHRKHYLLLSVFQVVINTYVFLLSTSTLRQIFYLYVDFFCSPLEDQRPSFRPCKGEKGSWHITGTQK